MSNNVKTTRIEKKYTDKSGQQRTITIDAARVPDRLKAFREDNPKASIKTTPLYQDDGSLLFRAEIIKDRSDEFSAAATGHARYTAKELSNTKAFEALETMAIGRALAVLGYLNNGEVATTEEMDEFNQYKENRLESAIEKLNNAKDIDELKSIFLSLDTLVKNPKVVTAKDLKKLELQKASK
jgi:hypothetical protein